MSWEYRNGKRYYYRRVRRGGRLQAEYIGAGLLAEMEAEQDQAERKQREAQRKAWRRVRAQVRRAEGDLNHLQEFTRMLTRAALLTAGYHPHKSQWRKRTDG